MAVDAVGHLPTLKFWLEWGGGCLWPTDPDTSARWGYPVEVSRLGLMPDLVQRLEALETWHDTALNWEYPAGQFPLWGQAECDRFYGEVLAIHRELVAALADRFTVDLAQDHYVGQPIASREVPASSG